MKEIILAAMIFTGTANAANNAIKYDCDYDFDGHTHTVQVEYNNVTEALKIDGDIHGQDVRSILNYKSRYQFFKDTVIIRDRFSQKLISNSAEVTNLKCEIYGA